MRMRRYLLILFRWVVSDPVNVSEADDDDETEEVVPEEDDEDDEGKEGLSDFGDGDDNKGKAAVLTGPNAITVRTRLSDRGTDVLIATDKDQPVRALIKRIQSEAGVFMPGIHAQIRTNDYLPRFPAKPS